MSHLGIDLDEERNSRRQTRRRRGTSCLAVLVAVAVLAAIGYAVFAFGLSALKSRLASAPDYPGPGHGRVVVQVKKGQDAAQIGNTLKDKGVVKSVEAFTDAARSDPNSVGIQVGFYPMKLQMSAEGALKVLEDPNNLVQDTVTIPEGYTVRQIVARLAKDTRFHAKAFRAVLKHPSSIGLPAYAKGDPEGFLFPATYAFPPDATPTSMLTDMVRRFRQASTKYHLASEATKLGHSEHDLVVVASLVQAEARQAKDFGKVSRVIYNRLRKHMPLQFDSTIHYVLRKKGILSTTTQETQIQSPYNTYLHPGLPPTPIMSPGDQAIRAALNPTPGNWIYFVTTNPRTGQTKFTASYRKFIDFKKQYTRYCQTSDVC